MAYVVEMIGHDRVNATDRTLRFSMGRGIAFTDDVFAPGALKKWTSATQKVSIDKSGMVLSAGDTGAIEIVNAPRDILSPGPYDDLADYAWQGRLARLYYVPPSRVWADRQLMDVARMEQPVATLALEGGNGGILSFQLRDPRAPLDSPLQTTKFLGDNVPPDGTEGGANIKGKPKPILYGTASNFPGVQVNENEAKLIWQLADHAAEILCVRDGGGPLTAGTARANLASLEANIPPPGSYDYVSGSQGTFVRLCTKPIARVTFDAAEGATMADRTHAQIWKRIRTERCGTDSGDINAASVTAIDALIAHDQEVGWWWADDGFTQRQALDEVLGSLSGFEVFNAAEEWEIHRLESPTGDSVVSLKIVTTTSELKATDRALTSLVRARPNFAPNGSPPFRTNVQWGKNYTVMVESDFIGGASQRLRDKFKVEFRKETAADGAIWDPVALTGDFPNAPELTITTGFQPGPDFLTCPDAATEAARLQALYGAMPAQYTAGFRPKPGDRFLPGQVVDLTYAGYNLATGPKFLVLQAGLTVENNIASASLVLGFQAVEAGTTNVVLLAGFEGSDGSTTIPDESPSAHGNATVSADAQIDTAQFKFGTSSLRVDGTGDKIVWPASSDWNISAANSDEFTVEGFVRWNTISTNKVILGHSGTIGDVGWYIGTSVGSSSELALSYSTDGGFTPNITVTTSGASLTTGAWFYFCVEKDSSGKIRIYINGVMKGSATPADSIFMDPTLIGLGVGATATTGGPMDGWIDEIRITKGVARYATDAGFTPPTTAFPR